MCKKNGPKIGGVGGVFAEDVRNVERMVRKELEASKKEQAMEG